MFTQSVDVIVADLGDVVVDEDLLSTSELGRALQIGSPAALAEYLAVHSWLRRRLAEYLDVPAADIRFGDDEDGKPVVVAPTTDLSFNLAYDGEMAVLAVGFRRHVGIDIERVKSASADAKEIGETFSSKEKMTVVVAQEMETAYLRQWVRKQSLGKATGGRLGGRMGDLSGESPVKVDRYEITDLSLGAGYVAAVAAPTGSTIAMSIVVSEPTSVEMVDLEQELDFPYLAVVGAGS